MKWPNWLGGKMTVEQAHKLLEHAVLLQPADVKQREKVHTLLARQPEMLLEKKGYKDVSFVEYEMQVVADYMQDLQNSRKHAPLFLLSSKRLRDCVEIFAEHATPEQKAQFPAEQLALMVLQQGETRRGCLWPKDDMGKQDFADEAIAWLEILKKLGFNPAKPLYHLLLRRDGLSFPGPYAVACKPEETTLSPLPVAWMCETHPKVAQWLLAHGSPVQAGERNVLDELVKNERFHRIPLPWSFVQSFLEAAEKQHVDVAELLKRPSLGKRPLMVNILYLTKVDNAASQPGLRRAAHALVDAGGDVNTEYDFTVAVAPDKELRKRGNCWQHGTALHHSYTGGFSDPAAMVRNLARNHIDFALNFNVEPRGVIDAPVWQEEARKALDIGEDVGCVYRDMVEKDNAWAKPRLRVAAATGIIPELYKPEEWKSHLEFLHAVEGALPRLDEEQRQLAMSQLREFAAVHREIAPDTKITTLGQYASGATSVKER